MGDSNAYNAQTKGMNYMMFSPIAWSFWNIWPLLNQVEGVYHVHMENKLVKVKVKGAPNAVNYNFTTTFSCNSKLVHGEMCYKGIMKLKA
jgi:hypothetical protein